MTGFEPATSCSQSIRATKLRYIPRILCSFITFFSEILKHFDPDLSVVSDVVQTPVRRARKLEVFLTAARCFTFRPNRTRTDDLLLVRQSLYQLSYGPAFAFL